MRSAMGILARAFLPGQGPARRATPRSGSVATAVDGAGHAIAVFGSSYSWPLVARSGSRSSLGDLKIVPGLAVMLAANTYPPKPCTDRRLRTANPIS